MALHEGGDAEKFEFFGSYVVSGCVACWKKWVETGLRQPPERMADFIGQMPFRASIFWRINPQNHNLAGK
jgi:hypothetical protein